MANLSWKKRTYVNKSFSEILTNLPEASKVFVEVGALEEKINKRKISSHDWKLCKPVKLPSLTLWFKFITNTSFQDVLTKNKIKTMAIQKDLKAFQCIWNCFDQVLEAKEQLMLGKLKELTVLNSLNKQEITLVSWSQSGQSIKIFTKRSRMARMGWVPSHLIIYLFIFINK